MLRKLRAFFLLQGLSWVGKLYWGRQTKQKRINIDSWRRRRSQIADHRSNRFYFQIQSRNFWWYYTNMSLCTSTLTYQCLQPIMGEGERDSLKFIKNDNKWEFTKPQWDLKLVVFKDLVYWLFLRGSPTCPILLASPTLEQNFGFYRHSTDWYIQSNW